MIVCYYNYRLVTHYPSCFLRRFGNWTLPPSSGKNRTQLEPIDRASPYLRTQDPDFRFSQRREARIQSLARSCGIYGGQSRMGQGFFRVLRFFLQILVPPKVPCLSFVSRDWYNVPFTVCVPGDSASLIHKIKIRSSGKN
jgi:hypothetical protein